VKLPCSLLSPPLSSSRPPLLDLVCSCFAFKPDPSLLLRWASGSRGILRRHPLLGAGLSLRDESVNLRITFCSLSTNPPSLPLLFLFFISMRQVYPAIAPVLGLPYSLSFSRFYLAQDRSCLSSLDPPPLIPTVRPYLFAAEPTMFTDFYDPSAQIQCWPDREAVR